MVECILPCSGSGCAYLWHYGYSYGLLRCSGYGYAGVPETVMPCSAVMGVVTVFFRCSESYGYGYGAFSSALGCVPGTIMPFSGVMGMVTACLGCSGYC